MAGGWGPESPSMFKIILPNGGFGGIYLHAEEYFQRGIEVVCMNNDIYIIDRIVWESCEKYQGTLHVIDIKTWGAEVSAMMSQRRRETAWHFLIAIAVFLIWYISFGR
jgi:hypothetical protein